MTVYHRIYIDTNVLIEMTESTARSGALLRQMVDAPRLKLVPVFVTSELTLAELLVKPYRERNARLSAIYSTMVGGEHWLECRTTDRAVLETAAVVRSFRGSIKLPDAIHIATAMRSGCTHFLTNDTGITGFDPVPHPFRPVTLPALPVIRPDISTLTAILSELSQ